MGETSVALRRRLRHLPSGLIASAVLAPVAIGVGAVLRGGAGAAGGGCGVALVAFSYVFSSVVIAWVDWRQPKLVMIVALVTYVTKFLVFGVAMAALAHTGWGGLRPLGIAVICTVFAWSTAQAVWTWHAKIPYVELEQ